MPKYKTVWAEKFDLKTYVLDNSPQLRAERFELEDIENLSACKHIRELQLYSNKCAEPIDLSKLSHIEDLEALELEKVSYVNMASLANLPKLKHLTIQDCKCFNYSDLDGLHQVQSLCLRRQKKIDAIPNYFGNTQMRSLRSVSISGCSLKRFPEGLELKNVRYLSLSNNQIEDIHFLQAYPKLEEIDLSNNCVKDLSCLSGTSGVNNINLRQNGFSDINPLLQLKSLTRLGLDQAFREEAIDLGLPINGPNIEPLSNDGSEMYLPVIESLDQETYHKLKLNTHLEAALNKSVGGDDLEKLTFLLTHPDQEVIDFIIKRGLYDVNSNTAKAFQLACAGIQERLVPALHAAFHYYYQNLDQWSLAGGDFFEGRLKDIHIRILRFTENVAGPEYTDLFKLYLDDYLNFSSYHQTAYKNLFNLVKKTKSASLTPSLIQVMGCERLVLGGDAVYLKKLFAAIKALGNVEHVDAFQSGWAALGDENREDVIKAYNSALTSITKRKVKTT